MLRVIRGHFILLPQIVRDLWLEKLCYLAKAEHIRSKNQGLKLNSHNKKLFDINTYDIYLNPQSNVSLTNNLEYLNLCSFTLTRYFQKIKTSLPFFSLICARVFVYIWQTVFCQESILGPQLKIFHYLSVSCHMTSK